MHREQLNPSKKATLCTESKLPYTFVNAFRRHTASRHAWAREHRYLKPVVEYDTGVVTEDLVQLLHKGRGPKQAPPLRLFQIKHIHFTSPSGIPSLLASQLVVVRSELRADVPSFVPRAGYVFQIERAEDEDDIQPEEPEVEPMEEVHEEPEPQELTLEPEEPALIHEHEPTEEEISAVKKVQATYQTYRKHRDAQVRAVGRGLKAQRNTIFIACLKNVYASQWAKITYRTLYLWALPRLIVCLDKAMAIAQEFKGRTKGLLLEESHERLEELAKQTTKIK